MKKALAMSLATCLLATSMVGCGGTKKEETPAASSAPETKKEEVKKEEPKAEEKVEIRISWWGGDDRHTATLDAIKKFEELNPNITVKAEYGGWDGHAEKITTQLAGGTCADLIQVNYDWISRLSKDGKGFYDLESLKDVLALDNYTESDLAFGRSNGILNAIPVSTTGRSLYYNKTVFDQVGVALPKTWEEFIAAGEKFAAKGLYPFDLDDGSGFTAWYLATVYVQQKTGKNFINEDGTLGFGVEDIQLGLDFYKSLEEAKVIRNLETRTNEAGTTPLYQTPSWIDGKVAGVLEWSSSIGKFEAVLKEKGQELVLGDLPMLSDAKSTGWYQKPSLLFAINKDTKYPEQTAKLLDFLLNDPEAASILGTSRGIPSSKAAAKALADAGKLEGIAYDGFKQIAECKPALVSPYMENAKMKEIYIEATQKTSYGQGTTAEIAQEMYDKMTAELANLTK
ncbi:ABC transporter substrate-binding protein [Sporanaerobium hydrogeniformans]|uniref:ABC transporter substrate-binding protein n=1 Tax=Sporanaerobium hydrogeniformans TaxID=3072179 RepID=A0AC61DCL2_9FIRM|nr:ABC transporter substrate-binding protein [Sporanaerobium hydrogeniformans]PHV70965.1 ABC transporter substrate-binding protein [Sporanaerobium hydrogeniformans]